MKKRKKVRFPGVLAEGETSGCDQDEGYIRLERRADDDPMRLHERVMKRVKNYFLKRRLTYLSEQEKLLAEALESILSPTPGVITAIPLVPGGGKSTLIRALLSVLAAEFRSDTPIAQRVGGVIVVVEKTAEGYELEELCNQGGEEPVATVLEGPNDHNLSLGKCANGTATTFNTCSGGRCPDRDRCPLMRAGELLDKTPILILFHARYERYMEDIRPLLIWCDKAGEKRLRTLLLIDEKPDLYLENRIDLDLLHQAEKGLDSLGGSYSKVPARRFMHQWQYLVRTPFSKLLRHAVQRRGIFTREDLVNAGFKDDQLVKLSTQLSEYSDELTAQDVIQSIVSSKELYYSLDRASAVFLPRLRSMSKAVTLSTFIFSGTATLSPELANNPAVILKQMQMEESYNRLHIYVQRGETFSTSKTGFENTGNLNAAVEWLKIRLPERMEKHQKILLVTYQNYAVDLWNALSGFHDVLIPYMNGSGEPEAKLPYFGGLNGSNRYQEATCVISLGLHRFEPVTYLCRAIATDFGGSTMTAVRTSLAEEQPRTPEQLPCVMDMQDISLAQDLVQLVFRSALRRHGEDTPVELWLLQPPNAVVGYLQNFFAGCQITEISDVPESCKIAVAKAKEYNGRPTHAAQLLGWLEAWDGVAVRPEKIRADSGLTQAQFKEARKHPQVQAFFERHVTVHGTGKNTVYYKSLGGKNYDKQPA